MFHSAVGQTAGIVGHVVDEGGKPVAGVTVFSKLSCCPPRSASSITDETGRFQLERAGAVLHIEHDGFQPLALVLKGGEEDLQIKLPAEREKFRISKCQATLRGEQLLGWGTWGIRFSVPRHGIHVNRGQDIDYVNYGIWVKRKGAALELWFGPTAFSPDPGDKLLINSSEFSQRRIFAPDGRMIGLDSRGHTQEGRLWRHTGGFTDGARYSDASPEEALVFDRIIDSMCFVH